MPTLQELIANAAALDDNVEFDLGGQKFKAAELRAFNKAVDGEKRVAEMKRKEAEKLADDAAKLLAGLNDAAAAGRTHQPARAADPNAYDWKTDPLYAPVVAELQTVLAAANEAKAAAEAQRKSLEQISAVYAYERMRSEYQGSGYKDTPFEELAQRAVAEKSYDRFGLPTLSPIIERLTEPTRIKRAQEEAVTAARKDWDAAQAAAAAAPGRGQSARFENRKSNAPPVKRIEDITSEMVAADPDVAAAMRGDAPIQ